MQISSDCTTLASEVMVFSIDLPPCLPLISDITQNKSYLYHNNQTMLHLHAWRLSGVRPEIDNFLSSLPTASDLTRPYKSIQENGENTCIGVMKGRLIH